MPKPIRVLILDICGVNEYFAKLTKRIYLERGCVVKLTGNRDLFDALAQNTDSYNFAVIVAETENANTVRPEKYKVSTALFTPQSHSYKKVVELLTLYRN